MEISIKVKRLGVPCGGTLFGKTVSLNFSVFLAIYIAKFFGLTIHYTCQSSFPYFSGLWFMIKVFIVGYGNIGHELAKRLRPFGVEIIASKRSWSSKSHGANTLVALIPHLLSLKSASITSPPSVPVPDELVAPAVAPAVGPGPAAPGWLYRA
ncbi:hypothetical protein Cgig2_017346 [Carnegiea gigantea]|uniref:D-isomer specific 2-hydroxyacid dehydrogenase NAD-binding domain-containing protein n=1 Tax=Carnegiea gigantea TaxID=171969 RepID=A0A9Q1QCY4_9CARY|nr:hypothetical protein Cgig2_017346 [Carnegiea gigantea]